MGKTDESLRRKAIGPSLARGWQPVAIFWSAAHDLDRSSAVFSLERVSRRVRIPPV